MRPAAHDFSIEVMRMKVHVVVEMSGCLVNSASVYRRRKSAYKARRHLETRNGIDASNRRYQFDEGNWVEVVSAILK